MLVAILLIIGGFLATAVAQLSGGWDEVLDRSHPLPAVLWFSWDSSSSRLGRNGSVAR